MTDAHEDPMDGYRRLRQEQPDLFRNEEGPGAIDIVDPRQAPEDLGTLGLVYQDPYIRLLRDPVRFPDGRLGTYLRILSTANSPGAAILPVLDDRVLLMENYRHAIRGWTLEIPRGFGAEGLTAKGNALKELDEELSAQVESITPIGVVHPDTGLHSQPVHLFFASLTATGPLETAAGIRSLVTFTPEELDRKIVDGTITDGFTLAALTQARLRHLIR
ncbi:NUDIX hydrolase [Streptomyces sp. NPDC006784]|uniref:NUDIX hydrolase n=1 Tax=Streptomyces sp. NPDC006784 TaxID=3364764 RepID=UPI0036756650